MVVKQCPISLRGCFPLLFPQSSAPTASCIEPPTLDAAPEGQKHFVYEKQRGQNPLCRLQMKYPKQKEVFYLRHMLLNFPKVSFADCRQHAGIMYASHEEAMLATGSLRTFFSSGAFVNYTIHQSFRGMHARWIYERAKGNWGVWLRVTLICASLAQSTKLPKAGSSVARSFGLDSQSIPTKLAAQW